MTLLRHGEIKCSCKSHVLDIIAVLLTTTVGIYTLYTYYYIIALSIHIDNRLSSILYTYPMYMYNVCLCIILFDTYIDIIYTSHTIHMY